MKIFTIGFTKKNAERFFGLLDRPDLQRVVDVRLNNQSQLAGFTKSDDLRFFLDRILGKGYVHLPELAPTPEMLKTYRDGRDDWAGYERDFRALLHERVVQDRVPAAILDGGCLLCSEATADYCHRRLVAEHFARHLAGVEIVHLQ